MIKISRDLEPIYRLNYLKSLRKIERNRKRRYILFRLNFLNRRKFFRSLNYLVRPGIISLFYYKPPKPISNISNFLSNIPNKFNILNKSNNSSHYTYFKLLYIIPSIFNYSKSLYKSLINLLFKPLYNKYKSNYLFYLDVVYKALYVNKPKNISYYNRIVRAIQSSGYILDWDLYSLIRFYLLEYLNSLCFNLPSAAKKTIYIGFFLINLLFNLLYIPLSVLIGLAWYLFRYFFLISLFLIIHSSYLVYRFFYSIFYYLFIDY